jgi:hypothetical protein
VSVRAVVRKRCVQSSAWRRVSEDDRKTRVADLEACELVGEPVAVDVFKLEESAVAGLDDDRAKWEFGQPLQLEGERAVGQRRGEVVEALALDGREQPPIIGVDGVVAGGDGRAHVLAPCWAKR